MQDYEYGIPSPRPNRLRNSIVRPHSQHRSYSMSHQDSLKKTAFSKLQNSRQSIQLVTSNEYYAQEANGSARRPFRESCQANRSGDGRTVRQQVQNMEKIRKFFIQRLQRCIMELREQIHRQSTQVFNLERTIEKQNKEIQTKSAIIKVLINRIQHFQHTPISNNKEKMEDVPWKRIQDLESRLGVIVSQIQQESKDINEKLEHISSQLVKFFGKGVWKLKGSVFQFIIQKNKTIEQMSSQTKSMGTQISGKLTGMEKSIQLLRQGVKLLIEDNFSKDNASQTTQSKQSISIGYQKTEHIDMPKEESIFSDYFFYPSEKDTPTVKTIELLCKQREELPIRVFSDSSGRLKYWQSRTFLFDRKGNFTTPSSGELALLEQRGWIKLVGD